MTENDRRAAYADLLADTLAADSVEPELLATYASAPDSLGAEDVRRVEEALRSSPAVADQLRVLKSFDASAIADEEEQAPGAMPARNPSVPGRRVVWGSLAAAAALALVWLVGRPTDPPAPEAPAVVQQPVPEPPARVAPEAVAPEAPSPILAEAPPAAEAAAPEAEPADVPTGGPTRIAEAPAPDPADAPTRIAETPAAPQPESPAAPPAPEPAPIVVAMLEPRYLAPAGAAVHPRSRGVVRGVAGETTSLVALVPEHTGHTATAQPSLFFHLSALPPGAPQFLFTLVDAAVTEPLVQATLPQPVRPGLQRIRLAAHGVRLAPGIDYHWSVSLRRDPASPSLDVVTEGWIRRVASPAPDSGVVPGSPADLASAGLWYDALESVADARLQRPDDADVQRAFRSLLASVGLESAAPARP